MQQTPYILERIPLGYIASYLGISQETLSRIRSSFNICFFIFLINVKTKTVHTYIFGS